MRSPIGSCLSGCLVEFVDDGGDDVGVDLVEAVDEDVAVAFAVDESSDAAGQVGPIIVPGELVEELVEDVACL